MCVYIYIYIYTHPLHSILCYVILYYIMLTYIKQQDNRAMWSCALARAASERAISRPPAPKLDIYIYIYT